MTLRRARSVFASLAFVFAFSVNPMYLAGCFVETDDDFEFGEAEMLTLLESGSGVFEFESGGESYSLTLSVAQSAEVAQNETSPRLFASAHACGSRTFEQSASACISSTDMPAAGNFTLIKTTGGTNVVVAEDVAVRGALRVYGKSLRYATLELSFANGSDLSLGQNDTGPLVLSRFAATALGDGAVDITYSAN